MSGGAYLLARSCVEPDEAYERLDQLAARLHDLSQGRPLRCRMTAVTRGEGRLAGICVAVSCAHVLQFEHLGYAFLPGTLAGDNVALKKAIDRARSGGLPGRFEEVQLCGGPGLKVAA